MKPRFSTDEEDYIALECWRGERKVTLYFPPGVVEYVKIEKKNGSPGQNLDMQDGAINTPDEASKLWDWLIEGQRKV